MGIKAKIGALYASKAVRKIKKWAADPIKTQDTVFSSLIKEGANTAFGKDHDFQNIQSYEDF